MILIIGLSALTKTQWYIYNWQLWPANFLGLYLTIYKFVSGGLSDVQKALKDLVGEIHNFATDKKINDTIKILIPQRFVAKIIGVGNNWNCFLL